ncbi:hypothetical protein [Pseudomonas oryzihabitans]|uniref:hypothetical protein n=1 Tax=Pseudomonas oryzihabitans TaxID=47885 RepID=UPI00135EB1FC|nr:hypothetical protein [Pseudomonas oryzihabitans]MXS20565.1 hypothetical protein [Pseudomonas oryzihabitans]
MATRPSSSTDSERPAEPGTAAAPPRLGEGCLARYDLQAMAEEGGADFSAAAALWRQLQAPQDTEDSAINVPDSGDTDATQLS